MSLFERNIISSTHYLLLIPFCCSCNFFFRHAFPDDYPSSSSWEKDRFMSPDIDAVTELIQEGKVWQAVRHHIEHYHRVQVRLQGRPLLRGCSSRRDSHIGRRMSCLTYMTIALKVVTHA